MRRTFFPSYVWISDATGKGEGADSCGTFATTPDVGLVSGVAMASGEVVFAPGVGVGRASGAGVVDGASAGALMDSVTVCGTATSDFTGGGVSGTVFVGVGVGPQAINPRHRRRPEAPRVTPRREWLICKSLKCRAALSSAYFSRARCSSTVFFRSGFSSTALA